MATTSDNHYRARCRRPRARVPAIDGVVLLPLFFFGRFARFGGDVMDPWLRYLIGFVMLCHGFIYIGVGWLLPGAVKGWRGSSWLLGSTVTDAWLEAVVVTLHIVAGILTMTCAVSIALAPAYPGWWRPLAMVAAIVGLAAFAVFWDGQARLLVEEGAIGALVSLILLGAALEFPLAFR